MENTDSKRLPFTAYDGMEGFAFISYSHADFPRIKPYMEKIAGKYRFWYDEGIKSGQQWIEEIGNRIYHCDTFIIFLSKNSIGSHFVRDEIQYAYKYAKQMMTIFLEPVELNRGLDMIISPFQFLNWFEGSDPEKNLEDLQKGLPQSVRISMEEDTKTVQQITDPFNIKNETPGLQNSLFLNRFYTNALQRAEEKYEILRFLGQGGSGEVHLVRSRSTGAEYVMKHQHFNDPENYRSRLGKAAARNELQKMLLLGEKSYTPVVVDYYESEEDSVLIMTRIYGLNLRDVNKLYSHLIDRETAASLVYQTALLLKDVQKMGLVFCDVKPSNVMIDPMGRLYLIDFGSTAAIHDRNYLQLITPRYAAPEQKEKNNEPAYGFDVYSLGIMMNEMMNPINFSAIPSDRAWLSGPAYKTVPGNETWGAATMPETETRLAQGHEANHDVYNRIIARMTEKSPDLRYGSIAEAVAALELVCPDNSTERILHLAKQIQDWDIVKTIESEKREMEIETVAMADNDMGSSPAYGGNQNEETAVTFMGAGMPAFALRDPEI